MRARVYHTRVRIKTAQGLLSSVGSFGNVTRHAPRFVHRRTLSVSASARVACVDLSERLPIGIHHLVSAPQSPSESDEPIGEEDAYLLLAFTHAQLSFRTFSEAACRALAYRECG